MGFFVIKFLFLFLVFLTWSFSSRVTAFKISLKILFLKFLLFFYFFNYFKIFFQKFLLIFFQDYFTIKVFSYRLENGF